MRRLSLAEMMRIRDELVVLAWERLHDHGDDHDAQGGERAVARAGEATREVAS